MGADIFFFTDVELLAEQTAEQAFGPVRNNENSQYRVTSLHSKKNELPIGLTDIKPNAYAICHGDIAIQPDSYNDNLVNLVLVPKKTIFQIAKINFVPVKYIIYKGIEKNSILKDDETVQTENKTDLQQNILEKQDNYVKAIEKNGGTISLEEKQPSSKILRFDVRDDDNASIDVLFNKPDENQHQFVTVNAGDVLGIFNPNEFGIEIIIDSVLYNPTLSIVRKQMHLIEVNEPQELTESAIYEYRHKKEEILNYMDVCAFYGSLYGTTIGYHKYNSERNEWEKHFVSQNEIYGTLLQSFKNKNIVYVDIRNEYNRSLNYLQQYSDSIRMAIGNNDLEEINYYKYEQKNQSDEPWNIYWPILRVSASYEKLASGFDSISVQLPVFTTKKSSPIIYISQGNIIKTKNKKKYPDELYDQDKFLSLSTNNSYTNIITIAIRTVEDENEDIIFHPCYIKLKYLKQKSFKKENVDKTNMLTRFLFERMFFIPFYDVIPYKTTHKVKVKIYDEEMYFQTDSPFVAYIGYAEEANNVYLFAFPKTKQKKENKQTQPIEIKSCVTNDTFFNYIESSLTTIVLQKDKITDGTINAEYLLFQERFSEHFIKTPCFSKDFICIVMEKTKWNEIKYITIPENQRFYDNYVHFSSIKNKINVSGIKYTEATISVNEEEFGEPANTNNSIEYVFIGYGHGEQCLIVKDVDAIVEANTMPAFECKNTLDDGILRDYLGKFAEELHKKLPNDSSKNNFFYLHEYIFKDLVPLIDGTVQKANGYTVINKSALFNLEKNKYGYLAEACTTFTMWKYVQELQDEKKEDSLIYKTIYNTLVYPDNKMKYGFMQHEKYKSDFLKLFDPTLPIGVHEFQNGNESIKLIMYNLMKKGYYKYPSTESKKTSEEIMLKYISLHLQYMGEEISKLVQQDSNCLFSQLQGGTNIYPQSLVMAVGDGTGTIGLLDEASEGILLFSYLYNEKASIQFYQRKTFGLPSSQAYVHLSIYGVQLPEPIVIAVKVVTNATIHYCCFYCSDKKIQGYDIPKKIVPISQGFSDNENIPPAKKMGVYKIPEGQIAYYDSGRNCFVSNENKYVASFDDNNNLYIPTNFCEVYLSTKKDEVQLIVNVVEGENARSIPIHLEDCYENDKFELTKTKKNKLLEYDNYIDGIDFFINSILTIGDINDFVIEIFLNGNFVGKEKEGDKLDGSKLEFDKQYAFSRPREGMSARELEDSSMDEGKASKLRYSFGKIVLTSSKLRIEIESYVSPVWSRLDERMKENYLLENNEKQAKINALNTFTLWGADSSTDAYIDTGEKRIPSYNPILSAFRSFGFLEAIRDTIVLRMDELGKNSQQISLIKDFLDNKIEEIEIPSNQNLGIAKTITFANYNSFKWYKNADDKARYN